MNNLPKINLAKDEREVRQCWPVFRELRPHIESEDEFVRRWHRQSGEGYQIAYVRGEDGVVAAAGYRFLTTMAWGHILYIDDLVATELSQGKGLGTLLLRFLQKAARDRGCAAVHLDTGYQRHRAHRAYLRNGFLMHCHHMSWQVLRD